MSTKVAPPGAITREVLRAFCAKYPAQTFSSDFIEVEKALTEWVDADRGSDAATVRAELTRPPPHKLDENLWRSRQQCEHIVDITDPSGRLAKSLQGDARGDMDAIRKMGNECLAAIVKLQQDQYDHVQKLVNKFLPNDFRTRMFLAYQKRSEQHHADDLDNYMRRGGTIAGKYDRLWDAQLKRRQMLAAVGNASGIFKAVIKYLAGVPQALLDFIHTINDDQGPMEEIRVTYGPIQYRLTSFINRIHVALAVLAIAAPALGADSARVAMTLIKRSIATYQKELAACLVTTLAVFKNSPMISVAEEADAQGGMSGQTSVHARKDFVVKVDIEEEHVGGTLEWEFSVEAKDIEFSLEVTPAGSSKPIVVSAPRRVYHHEGTIKDSYPIKEKGAAVFTWNNGFSMMTSKTVNYAVHISGGANANPADEPVPESL